MRTLNELCGRDSATTCDFTNVDRALTALPPRSVSRPVANCLDTEEESIEPGRYTVEPSNSIGLQVSPRTRIKQAVAAGIEHATGVDWRYEEEQFLGSAKVHIKPGYFAWLTSRAPMFRDTGEFRIVLANTTWRIPVSFLTPAATPGAAASPVVVRPIYAQLAPQSVVCNDVPADSGGFVELPLTSNAKVQCLRNATQPPPPAGGAVFAQDLRANTPGPNIVVIPAGAKWTASGSCAGDGASAQRVMTHPSSIVVGAGGAVLLRDQNANRLSAWGSP